MIHIKYMIVYLLHMDSTFTNSIMFGQGASKMFANSTDTEQKQILEYVADTYLQGLSGRS